MLNMSKLIKRLLYISSIKFKKEISSSSENYLIDKRIAKLIE
jgi:hypothetical protein